MSRGQYQTINCNTDVLRYYNTYRWNFPKGSVGTNIGIAVGEIAFRYYNGTEDYSKLSGADTVAIAYAIARNQESTAALQEMKKAYRDGVKQGVKDGADTHEDHTDPNTDPISIDTGEDGGTTEPYIGDLTKGLYFIEPSTSSGGSGRYVHMWLDMSWSKYDEYWDGTDTGRLVYDACDEDGALIHTETKLSHGNWTWLQDNKSFKRYIVNITINGNNVNCVHKEMFTSGNGPYYYNQDWSPTGIAATIMNNSTVRTTIPPLEG